MSSSGRARGKETLTLRAPIQRRREDDRTLQVRGGSGNAQATSSGPAMFDSATNPTITGGQFNAHHGDHTNVTINIHGSRIPRASALVQIRQGQANAQNVASVPKGRRANETEDVVLRPVRRSNEMYERHLMLKGRGFPLWIPQPNIRLPIPYRAKGVCIGDVGIMTAFGGFDFLFNICRARDDPINPEELPDGFVPIHPPLNPTDVREFREFGSGSYLASSSIVESRTGEEEQAPGLTFESSASEGAILTMPEGAFQEELGNLSKFRDYVAIHATNWYKFVNGPRGREAQNGDVRVVVGCDKTTSWGMATFANTSSSQQSNFRLKFRPLGGQQQLQHNASSAYAWEHSGVAEVRVGPEPGENEELGETPTRQFRNQCLFMRTLSITLSDAVWAETFPGAVPATNKEGSQPEHRGQYLRPPKQSASGPGSSSSTPARFVQGRRRSSGPPEPDVVEEEDNEEGSPSIRNVPRVSPSSAAAKELAPSSPIHHVGPTNNNRGSGDIVPGKSLMPTKFVDKLYHMINEPRVAGCMKWSNNGASFIVWNVQMFTEIMGFYFHHNNFSSFVRQLNMYGFRSINQINSLHHVEDRSWEFFHPKFLCDRPDLLHEIKRKALEPHWNPAMKDEAELFGDLTQAPARLGAMQYENMGMWDNPSKIINKYLLDQAPYAKIALVHDRDWSYIAKMGPSYLDSSKLIEEIAFQSDVTVDTASGVVFLEPKNKISLLTIEERVIIDQIETCQISVEQYLFGSDENRWTFLRELINQLRSDYMPFCDQYAMPARVTLPFAMGHPKRLLSLDDFVDSQQENVQLLLQHHHIHRIRSELNALPPQDPNKGAWLLRLADALSRRFWELNQKDDLEEAIWYYEEALSLLPQTHYHFLEAMLGLCSSVYQRFKLLGHLDDLQKLLNHLQDEHNLDIRSLLTPIKARLQERSKHLDDVSSGSKPGSQTMMNTPEILMKKDVEGAAAFMKKAKDLAGPHSRQGADTERVEGAKGKPNPPEPSGDSDPQVEQPKITKTTKDRPELQVPDQNKTLDMADEAISGEQLA